MYNSNYNGIRLSEKLDTSDADALFNLVDTNRKHLSKFSWTSTVQSAEDSLYFIEQANQKERRNGAPTRAIVQDDKPIGVAAIHPINWTKREACVGYWIDQNQYEKGIVTRAVGHLIDCAFMELELDSLTISTEVDNEASRAVAEKLGFTLEQVNHTATWQANPSSKLSVAHYRRSSPAKLYA